MALIATCCCSRSLRTGCYAAAIYTLILYSVSIPTMTHFLIEEQRVLAALEEEYDDPPTIETFLELDTVSITTVAFNITLLTLSCLGIVFSFLLALGVYKDIKWLLLPWLIVMIVDFFIETAHSLFLLYLETFNFNSITAVLFTLDFFIAMLNIYTIVCVISQFQEYLAGRGTAADDEEDRVANVQFTTTVQPLQTNTTMTTSGKARASSISVAATPSCIHDLETSVVLPLKNVSNKPKKHVKFPQEQTIVEDSNSELQEEEEYIEKRESSIASLWMEREPSTPPER